MYDTLNDVPAEIREFYEEVPVFETSWVDDVNHKDGGYQDTKQTGVTVQLKPIEVVKYSDVEQAIALRWPREKVNEHLKAAIIYDYFYTNHDLYLAWKEECANWEKEQPQVVSTDDKGNEVSELVDPPAQPFVDTEKPRDYYEIKIAPISDRVYPLETFTDTIDDDTFTINRAYDTYPKLKSELDKMDKLAGVEFNGVMCSATKQDMWGLGVASDYIRSGNDVMWDFENGNKVLLTAGNLDDFYAVWLPFRLKFFPVPDDISGEK